MTPCPAFSRSAWPVTFTVIAAVILLSLEVAPAEITGGGILGTPSAIVASLEKAVARLTEGDRRGTGEDRHFASAGQPGVVAEPGHRGTAVATGYSRPAM